ncbi:hypothetical protein ACEPPN_017550 [Leptodophora sp. 'Broadleaf-Isolate-01']
MGLLTSLTDTAASENSTNTIDIAQTLEGVLAKVNQNQLDLADANKGTAAAATVDDQGVEIVDALLDIDSNAATKNGNGATAKIGNGNAATTATNGTLLLMATDETEMEMAVTTITTTATTTTTTTTAVP